MCVMCVHACTCVCIYVCISAWERSAGMNDELHEHRSGERSERASRGSEKSPNSGKCPQTDGRTDERMDEGERTYEANEENECFGKNTQNAHTHTYNTHTDIYPHAPVHIPSLTHTPHTHHSRSSEEEKKNNKGKTSILTEIDRSM